MILSFPRSRRMPKKMDFADCFSVCFSALSEIQIEDRLILVKCLFDKTRLDYERARAEALTGPTDDDLDDVQNGYDTAFPNHGWKE
ncbi:MAG: hypothetical protein AB7V46_19510 [Thermomicrobiales bacterium]